MKQQILKYSEMWVLILGLFAIDY